LPDSLPLIGSVKAELYSVLREPCQSFLAAFERRKFATGKALYVLREQLRKVLCSHPCGFLDPEPAQFS
jgi:hypothetical protein